MNFEVQILPGKPKVVEGVSRKTGQAYKIVQQAAYLMLPDGTGAAWMIQPPRDADPYPPGKYSIDPASFWVQDGKLAFAPRLIPAAK